MNGTRRSGDRGAGDAERPQFPRARPAPPYDPRQGAAGPQASREVPGYEFERPRRERDTGGFDRVRDDRRPPPDRQPPPRRYPPAATASGAPRPAPPGPRHGTPASWHGAPASWDGPPDLRHGPPAPRHGTGAGRHRDSLDGRQGDGALRQLRSAPDDQPEPGLAGRLAGDVAAVLRSRNWVSGLAVPILAAMAVGVAVVVIAGANSGSAGPAPSSLAAGFPPARPAGADFTGTHVAVNAIAASGTTQVAAGSADGLPALWVSANGGSAWARGTGATAAVLRGAAGNQLTGVAHGTAGWLAVGGAMGGATTAPKPPLVVGSPDGRTWRAVNTAGAFTGQQQVVTTAAAAGAARYVIVGRESAGGRTVAAAWDAPGPVGWQHAAMAQPATGDSQLNAVTATGKGFVAVGSAGTRPVAWLSATGQTWSLVALPQPAGAAGAQASLVAANGNTVAVAGTEVTAGGQRAPFAAVSADGGATWTLAALPAPAAAGNGAGTSAVTALAAAGGGFTATGTYGTPGRQDVVIWTLAPGAAAGTAWTAAAPDGMGLAGPGTQAITALTGAGSTLTGVGFAATQAVQPTIWQSPVRN